MVVSCMLVLPNFMRICAVTVFKQYSYKWVNAWTPRHEWYYKSPFYRCRSSDYTPSGINLFGNAQR